MRARKTSFITLLIVSGLLWQGCVSANSDSSEGMSLTTVNGGSESEAIGSVPGLVNLSILPGHQKLKFSFSFKDKAAVKGVRIVQKDSNDIAGPKDGTLAFEGPEEQVVISDLENGRTYYFKIYAVTEDDRYSKPLSGEGTPGLNFSQTDYLKASNVGEGDLFGGSVALSGDTLVIGAVREDGDASSSMQKPNDDALNAGGVYVFKKVSTGWTQSAYLKPSDIDSQDRFGQNVALDGNILAVGAPDESGDKNSTMANPNNNAARAGAVYIFVRTGDTWSQEAYLKAFNARAFDQFGSALAISGNTVVVGCERDSGDANSTMENPNENEENSGAAHVFVRNGTTWTQQAYLKAFNAEKADLFGASVDISRDSIIVGARFEEGDANSTMENPNEGNGDAVGAAYVFTRTGDLWKQEAYLKAFNAESGDAYGTIVAIRGGYAMVGASAEDGDINSTVQNPNNNSQGAGAVYIYKKDGDAWPMKSYLKVSTPGLRNFGRRIDVSDDLLVISSQKQGDFSGRVHVFSRTGDELDLLQSVEASNIEADDLFGSGLAVDGNTIAIGAPEEDGDQNSTITNPNNLVRNAGACYVWEADLF